MSAEVSGQPTQTEIVPILKDSVRSIRTGISLHRGLRKGFR